ncbi:MAG TPA: hypothetical protein VHX52_07825 [Steroidobacteraceae bacterium]|nr:hypothetical protein [Steroidobacteraceae bacterium]
MSAVEQSVPGIAAELRRFLELGAAQLDAAIRDSDARVDQLADAITSVATDARELQAQLQVLDSPDAAAVQQARTRITRLSDMLGAHVQATITALQFYDKLIQRLTHVREGLAIPSDSAAGAVNLGSSDWNALLEQVRSRYSMVEERVLFDFMMRGLNADQMLKALTGLRASAASGEFEAF